MSTLTLTRTDTGYQTQSVAVIKNDLSPRQAQFAVFAIGHALSYSDVAKQLGRTTASTEKLAQELFWKLRVNNLIQAAKELHKRKMIEYLCLICMAFTSGLPEANAIAKRQPPRPARSCQARRGSQRKQPQLKNAYHQIEGDPMSKAISMFAADIQAKEPERQAINDAINAPHNGTKHPIKIQKIPRGVSAYTPKKDEKETKQDIRKRQLKANSSVFAGKK